MNVKRIFIVCFLIFESTKIFSQVNPVKTHIPSSVADSTGIALLIHFPDSARYDSCGAPVAIVIAGGKGSAGIIINYPAVMTNYGFIEVFFNFPGGGVTPSASGGNYDLRGPDCITALRDVIRFCSGEIPNMGGHYLQELNSVVPDYQDVGLVGGSNGGNIALAVTGMFGNNLPGLKWITNWESPIGNENVLADAGTNFYGTPTDNNAYNDSTGVYDYSKLKYSDTLRTDYFSGTGLDTVAGLYFDNNNNGIPRDSVDFSLLPLFYGTGIYQRAFYSEKIIELGYSMGLIPTSKPNYIPTLQEAKDFWKWRNGENWIDSIGIKRPDLLFTVTGREHDHYINSPDHPGVLNQYSKFVTAGTNIVRLNPDKSYLEYVLGSVYPGLPDNACFAPFDHLTIRNAMVPDSVDEKLLYTAAACELADRSARHDLRYQLDSVYANCKRYIPPPIVYNDSTATDPGSPADSAGIIQFISEHSLKKISPKLFPNPSSSNSTLLISSSENDFVKIEIADVTGKIISSENKNLVHGENQFLIHTTLLERGIYLVSVKNKSGVYTLKLEVLH